MLSQGSTRFPLGLGLLLGVLLLQPFSLAYAQSTIQFSQLSREYSRELSVIASDKAAKTFFLNSLGPQVDLTPQARLRARLEKKAFPHPQMARLISRFTAALVLWQFAKELDEHFATVRLNSFLTGREKQIKWVLHTLPDTKIDQLLALAQVLAQVHPSEPPPQVALPLYADYVQYLLTRYPDWIDSEAAWITIAARDDGAQVILARLSEYWTSHLLTAKRPGKDEQQAYEARFLLDYFIPMVTAYFRADVLQVQAWSEQQGLAYWQALLHWKEHQRYRHSLSRLCGTWQWLIHNHQDHQDHKIVMMFPPPDEFARMDPQPARLLVNGNTVYIRWEFPNGIIQEESLLLSHDDKRLEGSFVNSVGPYGNITARRLAPCPPRSAD
ncbi:MAG: hypothetical protein D6704_04625 [Nitrospirae bacterium]|nr:MAG: hypothetical protein D6704_04625 [Nitrospirota bacterium]